MGAIGNGEGAQAHGWGLYFAADRRISEDYKNRLSSGITINGDSFIAIMHPFKQVVLKNGIELPENKSLITLIDTLQKEGSYEKALEKLGKDSNSRLKGKAIRAKGALEILKKYSPEEISFGGKLYEVEIPDTNVMGSPPLARGLAYHSTAGR